MHYLTGGLKLLLLLAILGVSVAQDPEPTKPGWYCDWTIYEGVGTGGEIIDEGREGPCASFFECLKALVKRVIETGRRCGKTVTLHGRCFESGGKKKRSTDDQIFSVSVDEACAEGDPHFTTFRGRKLNFQGDCSYVFAETDFGVPHMSNVKIIGVMERLKPRFKTTLLKEMKIHVGGEEIEMYNDGVVEIGGDIIIDDVDADQYYVFFYDDGSAVFVHKATFLSVYFSAKYKASVLMPTNIDVRGFLGPDTDELKDANGDVQPDNPHGHCLIGDSYQVEPEAQCSFDCP